MSDGGTPGLDRLQALFAWWGFPNNERSNSAPPLAALSDAVAKLQRGYLDAFARNMDAMLAVNDRVSRAGTELLRARTMSEVSQVQNALFAALSEAAATHGDNWSDFQRLLVEVMGDGWAKRPEAERAPETAPPPARQVPITVTPAAQQETAKQETAKQEASKPATASAA